MNWQIKRLSNCTKSLLHAWMTITSKKKKQLETVGTLSNVRFQIVLKCFFLTRILRLEVLWSVNKISRAVAKWTRACGKRLARLISYIHHTSDHRQCCHVAALSIGIVHSDFAGDIVDSKSTSGELCVSSEVEHSLLQIGCVRNKLQSLTVPQNLKLFLWTLVFAWTVSPLSISLGFWFQRYCILLKTFRYGDTHCETKPKANIATQTPKRRNTASEMILIYSMWITLSPTQNLLTSKPCCTFLKTMKQ